MIEFIYNNIKNPSPDYMFFELNYDYQPFITYKNKIDPCSMSRPANKQAEELRILIFICQQNLLYTHKLQKQAHNKNVKLYSYVSIKKI